MTASRSRRSPRVEVKITQDVIDTAQQRDSSHCMIADAVQKALPKARYISVDLATIRFTDVAAGLRYIYLTPRSAQKALLDFDQGKPTEPFTTRLSGAHVLLTGSARKAKASLEPQRSGITPERRDGLAAPLGPLGGVASQRERKPRTTGDDPVRTGRRREYGLRAIIE